MALMDRPGVQRLVKLAEERTGVAVRSTSTVQRQALREREYEAIVNEAEELAYASMDYLGGRPTELRREQRRRLAQRSRIALLEDPLAAAEAQLLGDFAFGKGVNEPVARDPAVQRIIREAWTDSNNFEKLTGYRALRRLSNELLTTGELFHTAHIAGGRIRVGRLDSDLVTNIVPDPDDRARPLWFVTRVRRYHWNFQTDQPEFEFNMANGMEEVKYWRHWRNVDDAERDRELGLSEDEEPLQMPPPEKRARGLVFHVAINQTGEQLRGNPPWARSLRFMTAMNVLTEAHVTMAQAASSFIARRSMRGTPRQIRQAAASILSSVGELGTTRRGTGRPEPTTQPFTAPGTPGPAPPGSWWNESESSTLEPLNLSSGAGQMAQTAQIVRAPLSASSGFGQHYLGDMSNASLAGASTLELPATMRIGAWQESHEEALRWFTDLAIEAAVHAGLLGGMDGFDSGSLTEMRLSESQDREAIEERTGHDLSYEFTMPFPGRRQLTDVASVVTEMAAAYDPQGMNVPLRRLLLKLLLDQCSIDDVTRAVQECVPEAGLPGAGPGFAPAAPGEVGGVGSTAPTAGAAAGEPSGEQQQPYGAKSKGTTLQEAEWIPLDMRARVAALGRDTGDLFSMLVIEPSRRAVVGVGVNGHGEA